MVIAGAPVVAVTGDSEERVAEQRTTSQIRCPRHFLVHQLLGGASGISLLANIDERHLPLPTGVDVLAWSIACLDKSEVEGIGSQHDSVQRLLEQPGIDWAENLQVFPDVVARIQWVDHLRGPNPHLRGGQRQPRTAVINWVFREHHFSRFAGRAASPLQREDVVRHAFLFQPQFSILEYQTATSYLRTTSRQTLRAHVSTSTLAPQMAHPSEPSCGSVSFRDSLNSPRPPGTGKSMLPGAARPGLYWRVP